MSNTIAILNDGPSTVEYWLEPWGDGEGLPPNATASISFRPEDPIELLIEVRPGRVMVWVNNQSMPEDDASPRLFVIHEGLTGTPPDGGS